MNWASLGWEHIITTAIWLICATIFVFTPNSMFLLKKCVHSSVAVCAPHNKNNNFKEKPYLSSRRNRWKFREAIKGTSTFIFFLHLLLFFLIKQNTEKSKRNKRKRKLFQVVCSLWYYFTLSTDFILTLIKFSFTAFYSSVPRPFFPLKLFAFFK